MMTTTQLEVIIVSGGIGGLTAAVALRRSGHAVAVYERSSFSHEVGQGITIGPSGGRVLRDLGLDAQDARLVEYLGVDINRADDLKPMMPPMDLSGDVDKYGIHMYTAYWPDLHLALLNLARNPEGDGPPVKVLPRIEVTEFDCERGSVVLANGDKAVADLVVAADGVHSKAAAHIHPGACPPLESRGTSVCRFTVPTQHLLDDPDTALLFRACYGRGTFNISPEGTRFLVRYACRNNELQHFTLLSTYSRQEDKETLAALGSFSDREGLMKEMHD
jgi:salicylate hydroxylase